MDNAQQPIYLDYAATTPVDPAVLAAMQPYWTEHFGNPSSTHSSGHAARRAVDQARNTLATAFGSSSQEVLFTAGGTESDNLAIQGVMRAVEKRTGAKGHIVTTAIEHPAVKDTCAVLAAEGFELTVIQPERNGIVDAAKVAAAVRQDTVLVTVMYANNEVGTIQPIKEIATKVKAANPNTLVHTDACQAAGVLSLNAAELGVDLLTINGSKIYGPKGVGALYVRRGVELRPVLFGGGQEKELRPGTENVPAIVGFGKAVELAEKRRTEVSATEAGHKDSIEALRDKLEKGILSAVEGTRVNGDTENRLPNNTNILFNGVDGDTLLLSLDQAGIYASLGSACAAGSVDPSHVLLAMGLSKHDAKRSVRFTLGMYTTEAEIDEALERIPPIIERLRNL